MRLLPSELIVKTGPVDHADWNYRRLLGYVQRRRFHLARRLIGSVVYPRLLELGYGSGVFLPELAGCCEELYGVDVHSHSERVREALAEISVSADLATGCAESLPYASNFFDCIVAVSTMEFVHDIDAVCREVARVLRPSGRFVVITPVSSALADWGLQLLTGKRASDDFGDRRSRILPTLTARFEVAARRTYPRFGRLGATLYHGLSLRPASSFLQ